MYAASAAAIAYSVRKIKNDELSDGKVPLMAVSGAMMFAAQMINFTIPGTGASGHISGGILLAALLGPFAGLLAMSAVLVIQCLIFADGGLLALGANIFNIGVISCLFIYPLITKRIFSRAPTRKRIWAGSLISVILALQLGAFAIVLQTVASGIAELPFSSFVILMQPIHLAIGIVEGIVTAAILSFVFEARPGMLESSAVSLKSMDDGGSKPKSIKKVIIVFACIAVVAGTLLSLFASANPDGLEWSVIGITGADGLETQGRIFSAFSGLQERLAFLSSYEADVGGGSGTSAAGIIGAVLVFALAGAAAVVIRLVKKNRKNAVK
jgi:cobalt/nickel transport system permease protein